MKSEEREQLIASLIYGEISREERRRLEAWFLEHPEDREEYEALRHTARTLDRLQPLPDHLIPPLSAAQLIHRAGARMRWRALAGMAAACVALLVLCASQGVMIQIGSARVTFGPVAASGAPNADVREIVRQELAAVYLPVVEGVVHTLEDLQAASRMTVSRQAALEESLRQLATFQTAAQRINEQRMSQVASELVNGIDEKLRAVYPVVQNAAPYR